MRASGSPVFAEPLDPAVPFAEVAAHARAGGVIGVWLAATEPSVHPHFLLGGGRGPRHAALLVDSDLGALIRRVPAVLVSAEGRPCLLDSGTLAAARLLDTGDGGEVGPRTPTDRAVEEVLAEVGAARGVGGPVRVRYRFDSLPEALLG